jgi:hypothetical protein
MVFLAAECDSCLRRYPDAPDGAAVTAAETGGSFPWVAVEKLRGRLRRRGWRFALGADGRLAEKCPACAARDPLAKLTNNAVAAPAAPDHEGRT